MLENNSIPICTFVIGEGKHLTPPTGRSEDELLLEREKLQNQLDKIDRELRNIKTILK